MDEKWTERQHAVGLQGLVTCKVSLTARTCCGVHRCLPGRHQDGNSSVDNLLSLRPLSRRVYTDYSSVSEASPAERHYYSQPLSKFVLNNADRKQASTGAEEHT